MYKGVSTLNAYELCLKKGLCESHIKEANQNKLAVEEDELPRKAFLFIRINILSAILFKKSSKCDKIKILLQKTPIFSRILAKGDASEAVDAILVLDSVVVYTLCELSKICCIGALFQINNITSEDPEIGHLQKLLLVDRIEGPILHHLYPQLQKNFIGFDLDLIKVSYVLTLLFVRNFCIKLDVKTAIKTIEEDFKGDLCWENIKNVGDIAYQKGNYKDALRSYSLAVLSNSYSSELFAQRAQVYLKLEKAKAAQLDAYIAVIINPKSCEGYYAFALSYFHQNLYEDAYNISNNGLAVCQSNDSNYKNLISLHADIEMALNKNQSLDNRPENSVNHSKEVVEKCLPDKKYFPELVDSDSDSDKESDEKHFPELVEASDSDESENVEKKTINTPTKNKTKKKRIPTEDSSDARSNQMDITKVRTCLKEASEAILSDCGYKAIQIFRGPLRNFMDSPNLNTFEECEIVCIKYAYSIAYCKSGGYDDLLKCITILKEITEKHDSITFPAVYYALGLAYRKLNRFKDALNYLETVNNFLSKGIHFKVYPWPEITTVIQETKPDILKDLVHDLIKECENPPNPDALCRLSDCSYQPPIYYSDPDFKGYISVYCSEQCCLQYHLQCWKSMKMEKNRTDKEFLEQNCFTPDCEGVIVKIQNVDRKGDLSKEFTSDIKKSVKQKWAKWEKKTDVKEKKKKKNSKSEDNTQEILSENGRGSSRKSSISSDKSNPVQISGSISSVEKDATSSEIVQKSPQKVKTVELDAHSSDYCSSPVNSVQEIHPIPSVSENKDEASKNEEIPNVPYVSEESNEHAQLVQEMLDISHDSENRNECSITQEISDKSCTSEKENECNLVKESPCADNDFPRENQLETELEKKQFLVSQSIKNNVYSYMSDFLQHHGPLRIDDPFLIDELSSYPVEVNAMIADFGGIGEFLKHDMRFAFVGDKYICIVSDLATAYKMNSSSSLTNDLENFQSLDSTNDFKYYNHNFGLNPDALEYTPSVTSAERKDIVPKINADNSSLNIGVRNSTFNPKSYSSASAIEISNSQNNKSKICDTLLNINSCPNFEPIFSSSADSGKIELNGDKGNNKEMANEYIDKSEPNSSTENSESNTCIVNYNQNYQESLKNLCIGAVDLSSCDKDSQKSSGSVLEDSKIKRVQTRILPMLKEYCTEYYKNYHSYVNACIKPYCIRKLHETASRGTETDFENGFEITPAEHSKQVADALKAINKQLAEQNSSLKDQLELTSKQKQDLLDEVSKLKMKLSTSLSDVEMLKKDYEKKEEDLLNHTEYLVKSLTDAYTSIGDLKNRIELLEAVNKKFEKTVDKLNSSLNESEEKKKKELEAEEKKYCDITKNFLKENSELKSRVKYAEIQYLQTKKTEYLNRIYDKLRDASVKKQEFTRGLSLISGNLNPMVHSSMKTIYAQLSTYVKELHALKLEFEKRIDEQIEKVENGSSLKELKEIGMEKIPDPPHLQSLLPGLDKCMSSSPQMDFGLFNFGSISQTPSAAVIPPAAASTTVVPPTTRSMPVLPPTVIPIAKPSVPIVPQATPSAAVIPQATSSTAVFPLATPPAAIIPLATPSTTIIPPATPSATVIPQATPSATVIPQATPSATIIPQATPSATIIPKATPSTFNPPSTPVATVLSSATPVIEANKKNIFNIPQFQESFKNAMASANSFSAFSNSVTLDKEFNKTCEIFKPLDPVSNNKPLIPKVPPGIMNSTNSGVSSRTASSSSKDSLESFPLNSPKDSLETFPSAERTLSSISSTAKVSEPRVNISEQKKKTTGNKIGSSYDKLLSKLKEQFPLYSQEELISFVKEFRSRRQGKLTGLPMESIISELKSFIQEKEHEKRIREHRLQPKPNKVLVNKKLVLDPKVQPVAEKQNVKKKSAWGVDVDNKKDFSGNPDDDCTICCDPMSSTSAYKVACGHTFHEECIRQWLKNKSDCPICRVLLLLPEEYPSLS